jgi:endonuclease/exonuclease/phosphatase family metal-dependent hydrolase
MMDTMNTSRLAWALPIPFALWLVLRTGGWEPTFRWIQLVAFTPYVAAAALAVPAVAWLLRNRAAAVTGALVAGLLVWLVAPRAFSDAEPQASGPTLRVLGANLWHGQTPPDRVVELVRELRIDVLSLEELPAARIPALEAAGLKALLPHSAVGTNDTSMYSRFPLTVRTDSPRGSIRADLVVPGAAHPVEFVAVHTCAPLGPGHDKCWQDGQRTLPAATPDGTVRVMAGDFNSTLDHSPLRQLLDTGYRDAADVRGQGLAPTWPADGRALPPGIAIDHVVADRRVAIHEFAIHELPRSDHRAVSAVLTLP